LFCLNILPQIADKNYPQISKFRDPFGVKDPEGENAAIAAKPDFKNQIADLQKRRGNQR